MERKMHMCICERFEQYTYDCVSAWANLKISIVLATQNFCTFF